VDEEHGNAIGVVRLHQIDARLLDPLFGLKEALESRKRFVSPFENHRHRCRIIGRECETAGPYRERLLDHGIPHRKTHVGDVTRFPDAVHRHRDGGIESLRRIELHFFSPLRSLLAYAHDGGPVTFAHFPHDPLFLNGLCRDKAIKVTSMVSRVRGELDPEILGTAHKMIGPGLESARVLHPQLGETGESRVVDFDKRFLGIGSP